MINGLAISGHSAAPSVRQSTNDRKALRPPSSARQKKDSSRLSVRQSSNTECSQSAVFNGSERSDGDTENNLKLNLSILSSRSSARDSKHVPGPSNSLTDNSSSCNSQYPSENDQSQKLPLPDVLGNSDDFLTVVNNAAATIQIWYRYKKRKKSKTVLMVSAQYNQSFRFMSVIESCETIEFVFNFELTFNFIITIFFETRNTFLFSGSFKIKEIRETRAVEKLQVRID